MTAHALVTSIAAVILTAAVAGPADACGGIFDARCNLSHGGMSPQNIGKQTGTALSDTRKTIAKAGTDTRVAIGTAGTDTRVAIAKAGTDTRAAAVQGVRDLGTAGATIGRFVERQIKDLGKDATDAGKRIQQGKIVDAIWHAAIDPLKDTEQNAALATQESNILRTVGQVAATAYGGPGGAAA